MARKSTTSSAVSTKTSGVKKAPDVLTENSVVKEEVKEEIKNTKKESPELTDIDEINVVSLIDNVSYQDNHSGDVYIWEKAGDSEVVTFEVLKNMWRTEKGYFRGLWLKPLDERVVQKFGLDNLYQQYNILLDENNYTVENIEKLIAAINSAPTGLKITLCNKIKLYISEHKITDAQVLKSLGKVFGFDYWDFV